MSNSKILIVDSYYNRMLKLLDRKQSFLSQTSWETVYDDALLGTGFSYNYYFNKLGFKSGLLVANNSKQYNISLTKLEEISWRKAPYYSRLFSSSNLIFRFSPLHQNMLNFIEEFKPDFLFIQDINLFPPSITSIIKSKGIKIIGEIASPLPPESFFYNFDLIISSLENLREKISNLNVKAIFHQLGFDSRINDRLISKSKDIDVLFIGSYSSKHRNTIPLIQEFAREFSKFRFYGNFPKSIISKFGLSNYYFGEAWGKSMFELLKRSKIVINRHSSISGIYANNMRMFEVTGVGSLLLTEKKSNLSDYFSVDKEVSVYLNPSEAIAVSKSLFKNEDLLKKISQNGQLKTLGNHTYEQLAPRLIHLIESII